jgi:hypothetical protein
MKADDKKTFVNLVFFVFVDAYAQQTLWGDKPIVSPEIHSDNTVTFRMRAPKAVRVQITGDFLPMQHSNQHMESMMFRDSRFERRKRRCLGIYHPTSLTARTLQLFIYC